MGVKSAYLFLYNAFVGAAWAYVLYVVFEAWVEHHSLPAVWAAAAGPLKVAQTPALLEVVHAALGLVRSPLAVTALQVASRIWLTWGIVGLVPSATTTRAVDILSLPGLGLTLQLSLLTLLGAWGVTEVIRYSFFALKEVGLQPYPLLWLRYTSFIVLYPLGVASELAMVYLALPTIAARRPLSLSMPNAANIAFDYHTACYVILALYLPGFPKLYGYMLSQRAKVLRGGARKPHAKAH